MSCVSFGDIFFVCPFTTTSQLIKRSLEKPEGLRRKAASVVCLVILRLDRQIAMKIKGGIKTRDRMDRQVLHPKIVGNPMGGQEGRPGKHGRIQKALQHLTVGRRMPIHIKVRNQVTEWWRKVTRSRRTTRRNPLKRRLGAGASCRV